MSIMTSAVFDSRSSLAQAAATRLVVGEMVMSLSLVRPAENRGSLARDAAANLVSRHVPADFGQVASLARH